MLIGKIVIKSAAVAEAKQSPDGRPSTLRE
jgi:hypothetical protein